jgi:hypothetical protein
MDRISNRYAGDLNGQLTPFDSARQATLAVVIAPASAALTSTQHTAWMAINLLARCERCGQCHPAGVPGAGARGRSCRPACATANSPAPRAARRSVGDGSCARQSGRPAAARRRGQPALDRPPSRGRSKHHNGLIRAVRGGAQGLQGAGRGRGVHRHEHRRGECRGKRKDEILVRRPAPPRILRPPTGRCDGRRKGDLAFSQPRYFATCSA